MSKCRNFCFTSHVGAIEYKDNMKYLVQGEEVGTETLKEHIQGFVIFVNPRLLTGVIKEFKGVHWEVCKGSIEDNIKYCTKEGKYKEWGTRPVGQGTRTDTVRLGDLIKKGMSDAEIINHEDEEGTDWAGTWIRNYRGIREARAALNTTKRNWEMDVRIYWGNSGSGKTRKVWDEYPPDTVYVKPTGKWWDGYTGQEVVLIDDFDAGNAYDIQFDFYLKLLDRYPMQVEVKGGYREFVSKVIIFTSNWDPELWFVSKGNRGALFRRIKRIEHLTGGVEGTEIGTRNTEQKLGGVILDPPNTQGVAATPRADRYIEPVAR